MGQELPQLELRLSGGQDPDGQLSLEALARLAAKTQGLVTSLARGGTGQRFRGRPAAALTRATRLFLTGIHHGSTVVQLVGAPLDEAPLDAEEMPPRLGDYAIGLLAYSLEVLSTPENLAQGLPAELDQESVRDLADWLRELRAFTEVSVRAVAASRRWAVSLEPSAAVIALNRLSRDRGRDRLGQLHAVQGTLFAANLHTGRFAIEDDMGHTIGLTVRMSCGRRSRR